jgi:hypothetical protein
MPAKRLLLCPRAMRLSGAGVAGTTNFTMTGIRATRDPRCSGPDILDTMSTK